MSAFNNIFVVPNGYESDNKYWNYKVRDSEFSFGWAGTITHREDFLLCKYVLTKTIKQNWNTRIVIAGDPDIYMMFGKLPKKKKLFLPAVTYELYPGSLGYMDVFLVPLENNAFNAGKSDIKLVDAGAKGLPFIASAVPQYVAWGGGGIFVSNSQEWEHALHEILDPAVYYKLAQEGKEIARKRDMKNLIKDWAEALENL